MKTLKETIFFNREILNGKLYAEVCYENIKPNLYFIAPYILDVVIHRTHVMLADGSKVDLREFLYTRFTGKFEDALIEYVFINIHHSYIHNFNKINQKCFYLNYNYHRIGVNSLFPSFVLSTYNKIYLYSDALGAIRSEARLFISEYINTKLKKPIREVYNFVLSRYYTAYYRYFDDGVYENGKFNGVDILDYLTSLGFSSEFAILLSSNICEGVSYRINDSLYIRNESTIPHLEYRKSVSIQRRMKTYGDFKDHINGVYLNERLLYLNIFITPDKTYLEKYTLGERETMVKLKIRDTFSTNTNLEKPEYIKALMEYYYLGYYNTNFGKITLDNFQYKSDDDIVNSLLRYLKLESDVVEVDETTNVVYILTKGKRIKLSKMVYQMMSNEKIPLYIRKLNPEILLKYIQVELLKDNVANFHLVEYDNANLYKAYLLESYLTQPNNSDSATIYRSCANYSKTRNVNEWRSYSYAMRNKCLSVVTLQNKKGEISARALKWEIDGVFYLDRIYDCGSKFRIRLYDICLSLGYKSLRDKNNERISNKVLGELKIPEKLRTDSIYLDSFNSLGELK